MLLKIDDSSKFREPFNIDLCRPMCAEIPDPVSCLRLHETVVATTINVPCGVHNFSTLP